MFDIDPVSLARLQFAVTALYHFLFVPLRLGLSFLLAIMESAYVMTGREIWRDATKFWGKLFGINFAMGVATGITMEFQFGTNWAYYSHYVGDVFGAPLAIEGLMAFFLESTFVGLFFFSWNRLGRVGHLAVTFLVALGSSLSAVWILIANAWMQNPVAAEFNRGGGRIRIGVGALGHCPRRRIRIHDRRSAEGETGGDRGGVGNGQAAGVVHRHWIPGPGDGKNAFCAEGPVGHGADCDPLGR